MSQLQAILRYQEVDQKLYKLERELASCEERKEYVKYKKFFETAPEKLDSLETKAISLRAEADNLTKKYQQLEETLKDFDNLDELVTGGADVAFYQKKAQTKVSQLKKMKADLAVLSASIKEVDAEYQKLKKQVISAQKKFDEAKDKYNKVKASRAEERDNIEKELSALAKTVDAETMQKYQTKRKEKLFPVVGATISGRCPFCSMEPSLADRNKLTSGASSECENCHRIIFEPAK